MVVSSPQISHNYPCISVETHLSVSSAQKCNLPCNTDKIYYIDHHPGCQPAYQTLCLKFTAVYECQLHTFAYIFIIFATLISNPGNKSNILLAKFILKQKDGRSSGLGYETPYGRDLVFHISGFNGCKLLPNITLCNDTFLVAKLFEIDRSSFNFVSCSLFITSVTSGICCCENLTYNGYFMFNVL